MTQGVTLYWDGARWWRLEASHATLLDATAGGSEGAFALPELAEGEQVARVYLAQERLLVRALRLPLAHPRFLDERVLAGELGEATGEDVSDAWLVWRAVPDGEGIAVLAAALPSAWREALDRLDPASVRLDTLERLQARLSSASEAEAEPFAVLDADSEGICAGVCERIGARVCWRALMRLNRQEELSPQDHAEWLRRALLAAGWPEGGRVLGRVADPWRGAFSDSELADAVALEDEPQARADALADLEPGPDGLEFRVRQWAPKASMGGWRPWRRTLILAGMLLLVWIAGTALEIHRLKQAIEARQDAIAQAFARALPGQPIVDPLAQLRQAAGGAAAGSDPARWLAAMAAIHRLWRDRPWTVETIEWRESKFVLRGSADDLESVNRIRERLGRTLGRPVRLSDTQLDEGKVRFRMEWS